MQNSNNKVSSSSTKVVDNRRRKGAETQIIDDDLLNELAPFSDEASFLNSQDTPVKGSELGGDDRSRDGSENMKLNQEHNKSI